MPTKIDVHRWHMKNFKIMFGISLFFLAEGMFGCFSAHADIEVEGKKQFSLDARPLDIITSPDGTNIFILVEGRVLVYSVEEDRIIDSLAVAKDLDKLALTRRANALILSSTQGKRVEIINFQIVQKIDVSGLPFRGPPDAPVTIAVFSDYQ
jgi:hypothetical protein